MRPLIVLFIAQVGQISAWAVPASYHLPRRQRETPLQQQKLLKRNLIKMEYGGQKGEAIQQNCPLQTPAGKDVRCISYKKWTTQELSQ